MIIMQHLEGAKVVLPAPNTPAQVSCASATTAHGHHDGDQDGNDDACKISIVMVIRNNSSSHHLLL